MELSVFLDQILFVIVLYKQKPEESPAYQALRTLSSKKNYSLSLFIYDNSPEPAEINWSSVIYRHDRENSGVSKAYNEAALVADAQKKKWLMLLDQDTRPAKKFYIAFLKAVYQHRYSGVFVPKLRDSKGFLSPFRWSMGKGKRTELEEWSVGRTGKRIKLKKLTLSLDLNRFRFVNSGLLIELETFKEAKGYDETIPLDFSDIAFGEKLKRLDRLSRYFIVVDSIWEHSFSGSSRMPAQEALLRFYFFCSGSFRMGKIFGSSRILLVRAFFRSVRLSFYYKEISFLKIFFRHALK